jgi:putative hydrolase of the HAD superfamily
VSRPCGRPSRRVQAVTVFDLDDTLYLERDYVESGLAVVGRWSAARLGTVDLGPEMIARFKAGARGRIFNEALLSAGLGEPPHLIARMVQVYRQHRPLISLPADVTRFLARRPVGMASAVITDGYLDAQKRKIRALGLHDLGIELAVCTDRWGRDCWKPSPRAFELAEAFFGLSGPALTYVADNPNKDFHAPAALGWHTVCIARPGRLEVPLTPDARSANRNVESLDQLEPM